MCGFIILSQTISSVVIGLLQSNIYALGETPTKGIKHMAQFKPISLLHSSDLQKLVQKWVWGPTKANKMQWDILMEISVASWFQM